MGAGVDRQRVEEFRQRVEALVHDDRNRSGRLSPLPAVTVEFGRRFARMWVDDRQKIIWCFVDMTNGDILKPESWRRPAMHARGNLNNQDMDIAKMTAHGPPYLR